MSRVRVAYTAGEAVGPEIFNFFRALGVNMKQLYGQTEASVFVTIHPNGEVYSDTVGKPVSEVELRIADTGEVLYRSPGVFKEYFKNPQATNDTKTADGWVHTGDAGYLDDRGHLRIIDRAKDVGKLNDGTLFAPKFIENKLKFFPHINEAVAFGHGRDFVAVFVNIDMTAVGDWAERRNIAYASYQELAAHPDVYGLIQGEIERVNRDLAADPRMAGAQIRRFLILHKALEADDGELTRTNKVRRGFIGERYKVLVDALYGGAKDVHIKVDMTFEDGRKGTIEGDIAIRDLAPQHAAAARRRRAERMRMRRARRQRALFNEVLLSVENISLSFGGVKALTDISFDIMKGEIRAIIGPNGAGKSSMLNCINGFYHPQQGAITYKGVKRRAHAAQRGGRAGHRPHLPEHRAVPRHVDARQHHDRPQPAHEDRPVLAGAARRPGRARGDRAPQGGRADHRLPRDPAHPQGAGRPAALRPAEAGRARPRAGRRSPSCCCSTSRWPA